MNERIERREAGQTMAEYSVVLTIITVAILGAFALFARGVFTAIARAAGIVAG